MAKKQFDLLMALPGERRVQMAASMFDSAKRIILSDIKARGIPRDKWPGEMFRRLYSPDFTAEKLEAIANHLDQYHREHAEASVEAFGA